MAYEIAVQMTDLIVEKHIWSDKYEINMWKNGTTIDVKDDEGVVRDYPRENVVYIDRVANSNIDRPTVEKYSVGEMSTDS